METLSTTQITEVKAAQILSELSGGKIVNQATQSTPSLDHNGNALELDLDLIYVPSVQSEYDMVSTSSSKIQNECDVQTATASGVCQDFIQFKLPTNVQLSTKISNQSALKTKWVSHNNGQKYSLANNFPVVKGLLSGQSSPVSSPCASIDSKVSDDILQLVDNTARESRGISPLINSKVGSHSSPLANERNVTDVSKGLHCEQNVTGQNSNISHSDTSHGTSTKQSSNTFENVEESVLIKKNRQDTLMQKCNYNRRDVPTVVTEVNVEAPLRQHVVVPTQVVTTGTTPVLTNECHISALDILSTVASAALINEDVQLEEKRNDNRTVGHIDSTMSQHHNLYRPGIPFPRMVNVHNAFPISSSIQPFYPANMVFRTGNQYQHHINPSIPLANGEPQLQTTSSSLQRTLPPTQNYQQAVISCHDQKVLESLKSYRYSQLQQGHRNNTSGPPPLPMGAVKLPNAMTLPIIANSSQHTFHQFNQCVQPQQRSVSTVKTGTHPIQQHQLPTTQNIRHLSEGGHVNGRLNITQGSSYPLTGSTNMRLPSGTSSATQVQNYDSFTVRNERQSSRKHYSVKSVPPPENQSVFPKTPYRRNQHDNSSQSIGTLLRPQQPIIQTRPSHFVHHQPQDHHIMSQAQMVRQTAVPCIPNASSRCPTFDTSNVSRPLKSNSMNRAKLSTQQFQSSIQLSPEHKLISVGSATNNVSMGLRNSFPLFTQSGSLANHNSSPTTVSTTGLIGQVMHGIAPSQHDSILVPATETKSCLPSLSVHHAYNVSPKTTLPSSVDVTGLGIPYHTNEHSRTEVTSSKVLTTTGGQCHPVMYTNNNKQQDISPVPGTSTPRISSETLQLSPDSLLDVLGAASQTVVLAPEGAVREQPDSSINKSIQSRRPSNQSLTSHDDDDTCRASRKRRPNNAVIMCNLCSHIMKYNLEWKKHIKEKHWDLVKNFNCKECFLQFQSKTIFMDHVFSEHPKMLPFNLLPEKVFQPLMQDQKVVKKSLSIKSESSRSSAISTPEETYIHDSTSNTREKASPKIMKTENVHLESPAHIVNSTVCDPISNTIKPVTTISDVPPTQKCATAPELLTLLTQFEKFSSAAITDKNMPKDHAVSCSTSMSSTSLEETCSISTTAMEPSSMICQPSQRAQSNIRPLVLNDLTPTPIMSPVIMQNQSQTQLTSECQNAISEASSVTSSSTTQCLSQIIAGAACKPVSAPQSSDINMSATKETNSLSLQTQTLPPDDIKKESSNEQPTKSSTTVSELANLDIPATEETHSTISEATKAEYDERVQQNIEEDEDRFKTSDNSLIKTRYRQTSTCLTGSKREECSAAKETATSPCLSSCQNAVTTAEVPHSDLDHISYSNDNASTKSYAESPDRYISDNDTFSASKHSMNDGNKVTYVIESSDERHREQPPFQPLSPYSSTDRVKHLLLRYGSHSNPDVQDNLGSTQDEIGPTDYSCDESRLKCKLPKQSHPVRAPLSFYEVGNIDTQLNIRPGLSQLKLTKRRRCKQMPLANTRKRPRLQRKRRNGKHNKSVVSAEDYEDASLPDLFQSELPVSPEVTDNHSKIVNSPSTEKPHEHDIVVETRQTDVDVLGTDDDTFHHQCASDVNDEVLHREMNHIKIHEANECVITCEEVHNQLSETDHETLSDDIESAETRTDKSKFGGLSMDALPIKVNGSDQLPLDNICDYTKQIDDRSKELVNIEKNVLDTPHTETIERGSKQLNIDVPVTFETCGSVVPSISASGSPSNNKSEEETAPKCAEIASCAQHVQICNVELVKDGFAGVEVTANESMVNGDTTPDDVLQESTITEFDEECSYHSIDEDMLKTDSGLTDQHQTASEPILKNSFVRLERRSTIDKLCQGTIKISSAEYLKITHQKYHGINHLLPSCNSIAGEKSEHSLKRSYGLGDNAVPVTIEGLPALIPLDPEPEPPILIEEVEEYTPAEKWGCLLCTFNCFEYEEIKHHVRSKHIAAKRFFCPKCSQTSHAYCEMEDHILTTHKDVTALVVSRRCPRESDLTDSLCLSLPRETKWKNVRNKLDRATKYQEFVNCEVNFQDTKRYTCLVCSKQIRSSVLIQRHVAHHWKMFGREKNGETVHQDEVAIDDDILLQLFHNKKYRPTLKRRSAQVGSLEEFQSKFGFGANVSYKRVKQNGVPTKTSLEEKEYAPKHRVEADGMDSSRALGVTSSLIPDCTVTSCQVSEGDNCRSFWDTFEKEYGEHKIIGVLSSTTSTFTRSESPTVSPGSYSFQLPSTPPRSISSTEDEKLSTDGTVSTTSSESPYSPAMSTDSKVSACSTCHSTITVAYKDRLPGADSTFVRASHLYSDCAQSYVGSDIKLHMRPVVLLNELHEK